MKKLTKKELWKLSRKGERVIPQSEFRFIVVDDKHTGLGFNMQIPGYVTQEGIKLEDLLFDEYEEQIEELAFKNWKKSLIKDHIKFD